MNRWKASAAHLCISAVIATVIVYLMLQLWYPPPYFEAMGGTTLLVLIVGCDVVLGPLITLIIFKPAKKGLKMDLSVIACVQLLALAYGSYTIFVARPVFTVFAVDRFEVVAANDIAPADLANASEPAFSTFSMTGPVVVGARLPSDPTEQMQIAIAAANGGKDVKNLPRLYLPYGKVADQAARHAKPLSTLVRRNPAARAVVEEFFRINAIAEASVGYVPMTARDKSVAMIVELPTGRIWGAIDAYPW